MRKATRVVVAGAMGLFAWLTISVPYWNWYMFPVSFTLGAWIEQVVGWVLAGAAIDDIGRHGRPIEDDDFLILFNAGADEVPFTLPALEGEPWRLVIDTFEAGGLPPPRTLTAGESCALRGRSLMVLTRTARTS